MIRQLISVAILFSSLLLAGCATSLSPETAFLDVAETVNQRTGKQIEWDVGSTDDLKARAHVDHALSRRLTPPSAIQIALLNNKTLQAGYTNLGMAQADLVQAGLLSNPVLDGSVLWPYNPQAAVGNVAAGIVVNFIELFWKRYKKAVARSALEEVKIQIAGMVIDHATKTNLAFIDYVAAKQEIGLYRQVVKAARAAVISAKAIREAGNSTPLDFEQQQNLLTQAKLDLASAQSRAGSAREKLNVLMGLTGKQTRWRAPSRLPSAKRRPFHVTNIEQRAVEKSLELAALRQKIMTLGYKYQLTSKKALIPDIGIGVEYEKTGSGAELEREIGPTFDVTLPLFDQGQAKKARAIFEVRQAQNAYWALGIRVRSAARLAKAALQTTHKTARYFTRSILPQQARLLLATQQQYNAMQEDVFRLIRAKRDQIQAGRSYIDALKSFWRAYVNYQQILSGRLPDGAGSGMVVAAAAAGTGGEGGH